MFSLAENFRIDPKIQFPGPPRVLRTSGGRGIAKRISGEIYINVQLGAPPEYLIWGGLRLRDVNNISIPRVNSNLFFFWLFFFLLKAFGSPLS